MQGFADMFEQDGYERGYEEGWKHGWQQGSDNRTAEILRVINEESHDGVIDKDTLIAKIKALPKSRPPKPGIRDSRKTDTL